MISSSHPNVVSGADLGADSTKGPVVSAYIHSTVWMTHLNVRHLSLSGSGSRAVGLGSGSLSAAVGVAGNGLGNVVRVRERSLAHTPEGLASLRLAALLVGREIEGDEEDEVRAEDTNTSEGGKLLTCALASVRHPGPVGRGEVGVGGEVDEACHKSVRLQFLAGF